MCACALASTFVDALKCRVCASVWREVGVVVAGFARGEPVQMRF